MLDLRVTLARNGVFFAGETVRALVTMTNTGRKPEQVAWASAHVTCQARINPGYVRLDALDSLAFQQHHLQQPTSSTTTNNSSTVPPASSLSSSSSSASPSPLPVRTRDAQHQVSAVDAAPIAAIQAAMAAMSANASGPSAAAATSSSPFSSSSPSSLLSASSAAKDENSLWILNTPLVILLTDTTLAVGESQTFEFTAPLPVNIPPSHRGVTVGYAYRINVGIQIEDAVPVSLPVPFRVFAIQPVDILTLTLDLNLAELDTPERRPSSSRRDNHAEASPNYAFGAKNSSSSSSLSSLGGTGAHADSQPLSTRRSFTTGPGDVHSTSAKFNLWDSDTIFQLLSLVTSHHVTKKGSNATYNIATSKGRIARFKLRKPAYRLGEDVVGTFDFSDAHVACFQIAMYLECVESVQPSVAAGKSVSVKVQSDHQEFCLHTKQLHVSLPVPIWSTPEFETDLVVVSWRLRLEFYTSTEPLHKARTTVPSTTHLPENDTQWRAPEQVSGESLSMVLPVTIVPAHPLHVHSPSLMVSALLKRSDED